MPVTFISRTLDKLLRPVILVLGQYTSFVILSARRCFQPPVQKQLLLAQMEFVGNRSLLITIMAGVMIGGIFAFQLGEIFRIFGTESLIGASTGFALARELAPVVGAFLVTARAGSAMTAEIGSMRVNEQIDAMQVMAVDPFGYLMAPRILASTLMMPLISAMMVFAGVFTAFLVGYFFYQIDLADFFSKIEWVIDTEDLFMGMQKAALFGFVFSSIGCFEGYRTFGGAKGVGQATTRAVVSSYVAILVLDFFITYIQFKFQNK